MATGVDGCACGGGREATGRGGLDEAGDGSGSIAMSRDEASPSSHSLSSLLCATPASGAAAFWAAISSAVWNRPPGPRGQRMACL